jgi:hypothetical protein
VDGYIAAGRSTEGVQSIVAVQFTAAARSIGEVWFVAGYITGPPADMGSLADTRLTRHARLDIMAGSTAVASIVAVSHTGAVAFTAEEASTGVGAE